MLASQMDEFPSHIHLSGCLVPISNYLTVDLGFWPKMKSRPPKERLKIEILSQKYSTCFIGTGLCRMGILVIVIQQFHSHSGQ
jgi:hypothetical protein